MRPRSPSLRLCRAVRRSSLLLAPLFCAASLLAQQPFQQGASRLVPGDLVGVCGDSITEQKMYSAYIEEYLVACQPVPKLQAMQFGWGGETAPQFQARMANDMLIFRPTVATICYGMNDGGYIATDAKRLDTYRAGMEGIVKQMKAGGVRTIVVGTPGAVDTTTFKSFFGTPPDVYNKTLADFGAAAKEVAAKEGAVFADLHQTMLDVMAKAKAKYGPDYVVAGKDGIHPNENGHLVMAYTFLKALGCRGDVGTIVFDAFSGSAKASDGHKVVSASKDKVQITSTRYPFCFYGNPSEPNSTQGIIEFLPFNQDLNRFMLVVKGAPAGQVKITWGKESKSFDSKALAQGINLAAEFLDNPFSEPFKKFHEAVLKQQGFETPAVKDMLTRIPTWKKAAPGTDAAFNGLANGLVQGDFGLRQVTAASLVPVTHEIKIEVGGSR